jgi:hypothetical protein
VADSRPPHRAPFGGLSTGKKTQQRRAPLAFFRKFVILGNQVLSLRLARTGQLFRGIVQSNGLHLWRNNDMERELDGSSERRGNRDLAAVVEGCLTLQRTLGEDAARNCLETKQIPEHIILRVMSCAAFRRHPCNSKLSGIILPPVGPSKESPSNRP